MQGGFTDETCAQCTYDVATGEWDVLCQNPKVNEC